MMRSSRFGIFLTLGIFVALVALFSFGSGCASINRVFARKDLVDGSTAYKERKFKEAEELFRSAVARDPNGETDEGRIAHVFLARTLHSAYIGNRNSTFSESDFMGDQGFGLINKIVAKADPVSQYLFDSISGELKTKHAEYQTFDPDSGDFDGIKKKNDMRKSLLSTLANELNKIVTAGNSIYDTARFSKVKLSDFTQKYMEANPQGDKLIRLNRLLMEDAYPDDIGKKPKPEDALEAYQRSLPASLREYARTRAAYDSDSGNKSNQIRYRNVVAEVSSTSGAIAGLFDNLQMSEKALEWRNQVARDATYPETARVSAFNSLSARANSCANEITDTEATKKTVKEGGKDVFQYVKPARPEDLDTLKRCIDEGMTSADQALALEPSIVKNAASVDMATASDEEIGLYDEFVKPFESSRSYKAAMLIQATRLAEMEGRIVDRDRLKAEAEVMRQSYLKLGEVSKKIQAEIESRVAAKQEAAQGNKNANANKK